MFWILQYPSIQLLIVLWILQLIYASYATITGKISDLIKSIVIVSLFILMYTTIDISKNWLGTPSFTDDEVIGTLDGYDKFTFEGKQMFAIMVTTKTGPFMFTVPYEETTEKDLSSSMNKKVNTGKQTIIRKRSAKQIELDKESQKGKEGNSKGKSNGGPPSSVDSGNMEFYDFTDQILVPKHEPIEGK